MPWGNHDMGRGWLAMGVLLLLLVALIVVAVILAVRTTQRRPDLQPEQILADRLARGEIDIDEYQRRTAVLRIDDR